MKLKLLINKNDGNWRLHNSYTLRIDIDCTFKILLQRAAKLLYNKEVNRPEEMPMLYVLDVHRPPCIVRNFYVHTPVRMDEELGTSISDMVLTGDLAHNTQLILAANRTDSLLFPQNPESACTIATNAWSAGLQHSTSSFSPVIRGRQYGCFPSRSIRSPAHRHIGVSNVLVNCLDTSSRLPPQTQVWGQQPGYTGRKQGDKNTGLDWPQSVGGQYPRRTIDRTGELAGGGGRPEPVLPKTVVVPESLPRIKEQTSHFTKEQIKLSNLSIPEANATLSNPLYPAAKSNTNRKVSPRVSPWLASTTPPLPRPSLKKRRRLMSPDLEPEQEPEPQPRRSPVTSLPPPIEVQKPETTSLPPRVIPEPMVIVEPDPKVAMFEPVSPTLKKKRKRDSSPSVEDPKKAKPEPFSPQQSKNRHRGHNFSLIAENEPQIKKRKLSAKVAHNKKQNKSKAKTKDMQQAESKEHMKTPKSKVDPHSLQASPTFGSRRSSRLKVKLKSKDRPEEVVTFVSSKDSSPSPPAPMNLDPPCMDEPMSEPSPPPEPTPMKFDEICKDELPPKVVVPKESVKSKPEPKKKTKRSDEVRKPEVKKSRQKSKVPGVEKKEEKILLIAIAEGKGLVKNPNIPKASTAPMAKSSGFSIKSNSFLQDVDIFKQPEMFGDPTRLARPSLEVRKPTVPKSVLSDPLDSGKGASLSPLPKRQEVPPVELSSKIVPQIQEAQASVKCSVRRSKKQSTKKDKAEKKSKKKRAKRESKSRKRRSSGGSPADSMKLNRSMSEELSAGGEVKMEISTEDAVTQFETPSFHGNMSPVTKKSPKKQMELVLGEASNEEQGIEENKTQPKPEQEPQSRTIIKESPAKTTLTVPSKLPEQLDGEVNPCDLKLDGFKAQPDAMSVKSEPGIETGRAEAMENTEQPAANLSNSKAKQTFTSIPEPDLPPEIHLPPKTDTEYKMKPESDLIVDVKVLPVKKEPVKTETTGGENNNEGLEQVEVSVSLPPPVDVGRVAADNMGRVPAASVEEGLMNELGEAALLDMNNVDEEDILNPKETSTAGSDLGGLHSNMDLLKFASTSLFPGSGKKKKKKKKSKRKKRREESTSAIHPVTGL